MAGSSLSYRTYVSSGSVSTSVSFSSVSIGTEYSTRYVYFIGSIIMQDIAVVAPADLTVTIGGVTATCVDNQFGNTRNGQTWAAAVPSGTTATISFSHASRNFNGINGGVFTYNPTSLTKVDSGFNFSGNSSGITIPNIDGVNGGVILTWGTVNDVYWTKTNDWGSDPFTSNYHTGGVVITSALLTATATHDVSANYYALTPSTNQYVVSLAADGKVPIQVTDTITEGVGVNQVQGASLPAFVSDTPNVVDTASVIASINLKSETVSDGIGLGHPAIVALSSLIAEVFDFVSLYPHAGYPKSFDPLTDGFSVHERTALGMPVSLLSGIGIGEPAVAYYARPGAVATDELVAQSVTVVSVSYRPIKTETVGMRETLRLAIPAGLSDTVATQLVTVATRGVRVIEGLGLAGLLLPKANYGKTFTDSFKLSDVLLRFVSGAAVDGIGVSEATAVTPRIGRALTDGVGVSDTLAKKFLVRLTLADTVALDDNEVLKLLMRPTLQDGIEIAAGYVSPNGGITTWAVNTKNFATSEYTNYAFNSFAHMGRKYLGATSSGLYELNGNTDAGTNIIADIKSGFAQFGGSRFSSFKSAYLGMRGTGSFVLKLETGDGKTYNYAVTAKDMQTTRVHFGKGLRARYFAFELISTGQDFDLDDIEFVPLVAQRRV